MATLLRLGYAPQILSTIHLTTTLLAAWIIVDGTGGIDSPFSFLYLLVVLDASIIGSLKLALLIASLSFCLFTSHIIYQHYRFWGPEKSSFSLREIGTPILSHLFGVYLLAILAGRLGKLLEYAEQEALSIRSDLVELSYQHTAILESLPLGVITFDNSHTIKTVNQAASKLLSTSKTTLIGKKMDPTISTFIERYHGRGDLQIQIDDSLRDLKLHSATVSLQTQINSELQDRLRVLVLEDTTETKELEEKYRMQDRLASVGKLSASIAHEIRNPLAAISGAVQLLEPNEKTSADDIKLHNIVHREVERLNLLISDFLNYARPPSPKMISTNLSELGADVVMILKKDQQFLQRNIDTSAIIADLYANVDPKQMQQLLWNLLRNALEASEPDGSVDLSIEQQSTLDYGEISIKVSDTGPGINPNIRKNLFEPFVTNKSAGTGLGLAIAHRIVLAHHGQINVLEKKPQGTIFHITLPVKLMA